MIVPLTVAFVVTAILYAIVGSILGLTMVTNEEQPRSTMREFYVFMVVALIWPVWVVLFGIYILYGLAIVLLEESRGR